ncbi:hypothetical protein Q7P37_008812 [Cladosporium fusiforme]
MCSLFTVLVQLCTKGRRDIVGVSLDMSFFHANRLLNTAEQISSRGRSTSIIGGIRDTLYSLSLLTSDSLYYHSLTMSTNWGLLLGLIFAVLICSIAIAFLIAYCYNRFIRTPEEVEELNEKHLSLPRPATAPTVPDTPITGTAIQFNFSRPVWTNRLSLPKRLSQFTIPEHMAAGAIPEHSATDSVATPPRSHFRNKSSRSGWTPKHGRSYSRLQHTRARSKQMVGDFIMAPAYIKQHQRTRSYHSRTASGHTRLGSG